MTREKGAKLPTLAELFNRIQFNFFTIKCMSSDGQFFAYSCNDRREVHILKLVQCLSQLTEPTKHFLVNQPISMVN